MAKLDNLKAYLVVENLNWTDTEVLKGFTSREEAIKYRDLIAKEKGLPKNGYALVCFLEIVEIDFRVDW